MCGPLAKRGGEDGEAKSLQEGQEVLTPPCPLARLGIKCFHCVDSSHLAARMAVEFIGDQLLPCILCPTLGQLSRTELCESQCGGDSTKMQRTVLLGIKMGLQ